MIFWLDKTKVLIETNDEIKRVINEWVDEREFLNGYKKIRI